MAEELAQLTVQLEAKSKELQALAAEIVKKGNQVKDKSFNGGRNDLQLYLAQNENDNVWGFPKDHDGWKEEIEYFVEAQKHGGKRKLDDIVKDVKKAKVFEDEKIVEEIIAKKEQNEDEQEDDEIFDEEQEGGLKGICMEWYGMLPLESEINKSLYINSHRMVGGVRVHEESLQPFDDGQTDEEDVRGSIRNLDESTVLLNIPTVDAVHQSIRDEIGKRDNSFYELSLQNNYKGYFLGGVLATLEIVHPSLAITAEAAACINDMMVEAADRVIQAFDNTSLKLEMADLLTAIKLIFPGQLKTHALKEANIVQAIRHFDWTLISLLAETKYQLKIDEDCGKSFALLLEYLATEILELSGNAAKDNVVDFISVRHLQLAIENDEELSLLFKNRVFPIPGCLPNVSYQHLKDLKDLPEEQTLLDQKALREIRDTQLQQSFMIPRQAFSKLCKELTYQMTACADDDFMKITDSAIEALHASAEKHLHHIFENANIMQTTEGFPALEPRHMKIVTRMNKQ